MAVKDLADWKAESSIDVKELSASNSTELKLEQEAKAEEPILVTDARIVMVVNDVADWKAPSSIKDNELL